MKFRGCLKGVGSLRDQTQVIRFGGKYLCLLSYLTTTGSSFQSRK